MEIGGIVLVIVGLGGQALSIFIEKLFMINSS